MSFPVKLNKNGGIKDADKIKVTNVSLKSSNGFIFINKQM